jgi:ubiquinol-cytochrome c reductase cytochrome b subunit
MVVIGVLLGQVVWAHGHKLDGGSDTGIYEKVAHAGRDGNGAHLDAPADPGTATYPARPEWYFLFLFQLLKYFEGPQEIIGTVVVPMGAGLLLVVLPLLGYGRLRRFGHVVGILVVVTLLVGAGTLTVLAMVADRNNEAFQEQQQNAEEAAARAVQLADAGIPEEGAIQLLRRDPKSQGRELFRQNCATCHTYGDDFPVDKPTASDLKDFGGEEWIAAFLKDTAAPRFYGRTKFKNGKMVKEAKKFQDSKDPAMASDLNAIAHWLGSHPRGKAKPEHAKAYEAYKSLCSTCHKYEGSPKKKTSGPDFTGYGDADWLRAMIMSPADDARYGQDNVMPAFRDLEGVAGPLTIHESERLKELLLKDQAGAEASDADKERIKNQIDGSHKLMHLSDVDRELIIRWLVKDDRAVFGGAPISAPPRQ